MNNEEKAKKIVESLLGGSTYKESLEKFKELNEEEVEDSNTGDIDEVKSAVDDISRNANDLEIALNKIKSFEQKFRGAPKDVRAQAAEAVGKLIEQLLDFMKTRLILGNTDLLSHKTYLTQAIDKMRDFMSYLESFNDEKEQEKNALAAAESVLGKHGKALTESEKKLVDKILSEAGNTPSEDEEETKDTVEDALNVFANHVDEKGTEYEDVDPDKVDSEVRGDENGETPDDKTQKAMDLVTKALDYYFAHAGKEEDDDDEDEDDDETSDVPEDVPAEEHEDAPVDAPADGDGSEEVSEVPKDTDSDVPVDEPESKEEDGESGEQLSFDTEAQTESGAEDTILNNADAVQDDEKKSDELKAEEETETSDKVPRRFQNFSVDDLHEAKTNNDTVLTLIAEGRI